ncbi:MAG: LysR family transcriptional regulator [Ilumatobacter sp.]|nr:LysR family transcriptional regulator [Ilumatobacter sp.]
MLIAMATLRDLEFRHLITLDAIATEGTFGRAAERLGYTQSAISQQVAALERIIGEPLFDRPGGPRPVELTPLGEHVLAHGRALLGQLDVVAAEVDRFRHGAIGTLSIGTFQSMSSAALPLVVGRMRQEFPDVELTVFESDEDFELENRLVSGELEVSFVVGDVSGGELEGRHLLTDPFVLLARPGQFEPGPVEVAALRDEPMIGQQENSCQLFNEAGLRTAGLTPSYVFRSNDNATVAAMVRAGMGVAVMPLLCVEREDPRLVIHPLDPAIPEREISVAWRAGRTLSPPARTFIELAVDVGAELAERLVVPSVSTRAPA